MIRRPPRSTLFADTTRFRSPSRASPDRWFAAAGVQGLGARLEGMVVRRCLHLLPTVPPNCFLTVNVSPHLLTDPELRSEEHTSELQVTPISRMPSSA